MRLFARMLAAGLLGILFLVPAWTEAAAQTSWEFGLKAGVSATKLTGDDAKAFTIVLDQDNYLEGDIGDTKVGFVGGGYATMHVNQQFGVRLEALYFQKGGKGELSGEITAIPVSADMTWKIDYFAFPLLAVVSFPTSPSGTFNIFAGPAVGFNLSAKSEIEVTALGQTQTETSDMENISSTDFGGVVGAGFTLALTSVNIFADARWEWGFTTLDDGESAADVKNSALGFMVGVAFPLGAKTAAP